MKSKILCPRWGRCKATKKCPLSKEAQKKIYVLGKCANKEVKLEIGKRTTCIELMEIKGVKMVSRDVEIMMGKPLIVEVPEGVIELETDYTINGKFIRSVGKDKKTKKIFASTDNMFYYKEEDYECLWLR